MTPEIATLQIRVLSDQVELANARLQRLESHGGRAQRATDGLLGSTASLTRGMLALAAPMGIVGAGLATFSKLTTVTKEFGVLSAMLKTATGSAANAQVAFAGVQRFAAQTPFDLQQATNGFIKLVNYGLNPSTEALTAWGDFASAQGKDLIQSIEAVADASVGNWTRMKESFGIVGEKMGDQVAITFRGVTTTVKDEAKVVEETLMKLAQSNFGGSMSDQMKGLGGTMANLGDSWDMLFLNISQKGVGALIQSGFSLALDSLNELNAQITSGQLGASIDAYAGMWLGAAERATSSLRATDDALTAQGTRIDDHTISWGEAFKQSFDQLPANVKATMEAVGVYIYGLVEVGRISAKTMVDLMGNEFDRLVKMASAVKLQMDNILNNTSVNINLGNTLGAINEKANENMQGILLGGVREVQTAASVATAQVGTILSERQALIDEFNANLAEAAAKRKALEDSILAGGGDALGQFRVGGTPAPKAAAGGSSGGGSGGSGGGEDQRAKQLEQLRDSLRTEEEAISQSYARRAAEIDEFSELSQQERLDLHNRLIGSVTEEFSRVSEMRASDGENFMQSLKDAEEALLDSYNRRKQIILASTLSTETEKQAAVASLEAQFQADQEEIAFKRKLAMLKKTTDFLGALSTIAGSFGKKGYKVAQALAIAETTVNTASAAMKAYKDGGAYLGPAFAAAAIAAGAAQIAQIKGTEYQGAYADGGFISPGKYGMAGENGPEFIKGPAYVTSTKTSRDKLNGQTVDTPSVIVQVYNIAGQTAEVRQSQDPLGNQQLQVIIRKVEEDLTAKAFSGGGTLIPALVNQFKLSRA